MTKKPMTKEERKAMAALLQDDEGFEKRPGNEPARVRALAAKLKNKRGQR